MKAIYEQLKTTLIYLIEIWCTLPIRKDSSGSHNVDI